MMFRKLIHVFVFVLTMTVLAVSLAWAAVCGQCGAKVDDAAKFCGACGAKMAAETAPVADTPPPYDGKAGEKAGQQCINPKDGAVMVWVPAGNFLMGSTDADKLARTDEKPQHSVYLDGYWVYRTEVTVAQYKAYCASAGAAMPTDTPGWGWQDTHPMVYVNWKEARAYAKWAGAKLPSEAQWEKAARGTDGRIYPWGNAWDADRCNNEQTGPEQTMAVGSLPDSVGPYGCVDMAGNVLEWCEDWYGTDYYKNSPDRNPKGPDGGEYRVLRGGSWSDTNPVYFRCAFRLDYTPALRNAFSGFRCVVFPPGLSEP